MGVHDLITEYYSKNFSQVVYAEDLEFHLTFHHAVNLLSAHREIELVVLPYFERAQEFACPGSAVLQYINVSEYSCSVHGDRNDSCVL